MAKSFSFYCSYKYRIENARAAPTLSFPESFLIDLLYLQNATTLDQKAPSKLIRGNRDASGCYDLEKALSLGTKNVAARPSKLYEFNSFIRTVQIPYLLKHYKTPFEIRPVDDAA